MAWAPEYVTVADLAAYMGIGDSGDDLQLELAVSGASRAIDNTCNRQFGKVSAVEERRYTAEYDRRRRRWLVDIDDVMTTSGLVVTVSSGAITGYDLEPINAAAEGRPWTRLAVHDDSAVTPTTGEHDVAVTALWGWSTVPPTIKNACLLQASRFHSRRHSPYGVAGSPELGSELRLLARLDADVAVMLGDYVRWWAAA